MIATIIEAALITIGAIWLLAYLAVKFIELTDNK